MIITNNPDVADAKLDETELLDGTPLDVVLNPLGVPSRMASGYPSAVGQQSPQQKPVPIGGSRPSIRLGRQRRRNSRSGDQPSGVAGL